jgi:hypothetical protein
MTLIKALAFLEVPKNLSSLGMDLEDLDLHIKRPDFQYCWNVLQMSLENFRHNHKASNYIDGNCGWR